MRRRAPGTVRVDVEGMQTSTNPIGLLVADSPFRIARRIASETLGRDQRIDQAATIAAMRAAGHEHLVHYAGAAHRDAVAWHLCAAWLAQPADPEHVLKSRAIKAAWGWDVAPEAFLPRTVRS